MTPLEWIITTGVASVLVVVGQYWTDRRVMRRWGEQAYQHGLDDGWYEGWDDRDADMPRRTPVVAAPIGRHAREDGWSQPAEWDARSLAELATPAPLAIEPPPGELTIEQERLTSEAIAAFDAIRTQTMERLS
jgi:hypothetical protein